MAHMLDPEGAHLASLRRLADFSGRRVLELGCGDERLTRGIAADAASVLAFDPDEAAVNEARASFPARAPRAGRSSAWRAEAIAIERACFDLDVFSWSL